MREDSPFGFSKCPLDHCRLLSIVPCPGHGQKIDFRNELQDLKFRPTPTSRRGIETASYNITPASVEGLPISTKIKQELLSEYQATGRSRPTSLILRLPAAYVATISHLQQYYASTHLSLIYVHSSVCSQNTDVTKASVAKISGVDI